MNYVPGYGPSNAKVILVGESPGREEVARGIPFIGPAGRLLDSMLGRVGINRQECYVTNIMKTRPPGDNFGFFYEDPKRTKPKPMLVAGIEELKKELAKFHPRLIIALGAEPLRALTGRRGIVKWRGSVFRNIIADYLIATYHPSGIRRQYTNRSVAEMDLKRAKFLIHENPPERKQNFVLRPAFKETMDYLTDLYTFQECFAFDIEAVRDRVRCLGLSHEDGQAFCIPFMCNPHVPGGKLFTSETVNSYWTEEEEYEILNILDKIFKDPDIPKIAQNFQYDATMLGHEFGFDVQGLYLDTMVAQHCCYSELPKSLDFLCSVYTWTPRYSDYSAASDEETWVYNCMDASVTFEVAEELMLEMEDLGVKDFCLDHAQPAMIALTRTGNRGVWVDQDLRAALKSTAETELEEIKAKIRALTGFDLNPNSPKQMHEFLYESLKLPKQYHPKTHKVTADEDALDKLYKKVPRYAPIFDCILDYRGRVKLIGTFLTSTLDTRGKMLTTYNATGTKTGRVSSSKTLSELGGNMQQIPKMHDDSGGLRRVFVAPKGRKLVGADLSQAEDRVTTAYSHDFELLERFNDSSFDIHALNASILFGIDLGEVTKDQREKAKRIVHGINYGIGIAKSSRIAKLSYIAVKHARENYMRGKPKLMAYWKWVEQEIIASKRLKTPFGRQRIFFDRMNPATFRSAYSFLPQAIVAHLINRALYMLDRTLPEGAFPVMQVHDEIVVECDDAQVPAVARLLKQHMELEIQIPGVDVPLLIPAEVSFGQNWMDQEDIEI